MTTTYLFASTITDTGCQGVKVNTKEGSVFLPFSFEELSHTKDEHILVMNSLFSTIFYRELPNLSKKKLLSAIPFMLEDDLNLSIDNYYFFTHHAIQKNNEGIIVAYQKKYIDNMIELFKSHNIHINNITLDYCGVPENSIILHEGQYLFRYDDMHGTLLQDTFSTLYPLKNNTLPAIQAFSDKRDYCLFIANQLAQSPFVSLLPEGKPLTYRKMYSIRPAIIMSFLLTASIASFFLKDIIMLTKLNHEMYALDTIINKAYFQFFPTAKTVISPKFRMTEWIKHQKDNSDDIFFHLITGIDAYLDKKAHTLLQLTFKNNRMQLALSSIDFASLDTFQNQLKKAAIRSKLIQSSNKNHRVISSLELSL